MRIAYECLVYLGEPCSESLLEVRRSSYTNLACTLFKVELVFPSPKYRLMPIHPARILDP